MTDKLASDDAAMTTTLEREEVSANPLDGDELLMKGFFGEPEPVSEHLKTRAAETHAQKTGRLLKDKERAAKPDHYKIVSISLYMEDIERLNTMVDELKKRGHFKANKSMLIRHALEQIDLNQIPKNR